MHTITNTSDNPRTILGVQPPITIPAGETVEAEVPAAVIKAEADCGLTFEPVVKPVATPKADPKA